MMNGKRSYLSVLIGLLLFPVFAHAQYIAKYKSDGDQYFEKGKYYAAAVYYQRALKLLPEEDYFLPYNVIVKNKKIEKKDVDKYQYLVYRLGESFRLYRDFSRALGWYEKAIKLQTDRFPLAGLWYGVCLRAGGEYTKALTDLKTFKANYAGDQKYNDRAELEIASCQYAIAQKKYPRITEITKLSAPLNVDKGSDYAPMRIADTLFFTSSRKVKGIKPKKHSPYINRIYRVTLKGKDVGTVEQLKLGKGKYTEEAATSLNKEQNRLYFTEWQSSKGKEGHDVIVMSERNEKGGWTTGETLAAPVNNADYNTKEATITSDGKHLVFASDRPGGLGGYDIWYCSLNEEGRPTGEAIPLGSSVNTEKDERNPYYDEDSHTLFFSSNGRIGMGGYDLYKSEGRFSKNNWSEAENQGSPVNSSKDDNYFYPTESTRDFYTSSDRNSVCCLELYRIHLKKIKLIGHVYDIDTRKPIDMVVTTLKDSITGETRGTLTTEADGYFHFPLKNRRPLKMQFSNKLYGTKDIVITNRQLKPVDSIYERKVYLKRIPKPIVIKNIYYNFDKAGLRPESKPALDTLLALLQKHPDWIVEIGAHTDALGSEKYNQWLSQQRAQSVVDFLADHGISKNRLQSKGYGESQPIVPNTKPDGSDNPEGRQLNRRTEFTIIGKILQNGKTQKELKSKEGNPQEIKVDFSRKYHLSRSKKWLKHRQ